MTVTNIRIGFATNSSSTHSCVYTKRRHKDNSPKDGEYGWGRFVLSEPDSKRKYVAQQLFGHLQHLNVTDATAARIVTDIVGTAPAIGGYVDHQSAFAHVTDREGKLDAFFYRDLADILAQDGVVIFGGNDNDQKRFDPKSYGDLVTIFGEIRDRAPIRSYKDEKTGQWTLFNLRNGTRLTFDTRGMPDPNAEYTRPLLADVKITDQCHMGCPYCYQNSTPGGEHAKLNGLGGILNRLGIFEVAIGGGEPLLHPMFLDLVKSLRTYDHIVPNVSTRRPDLLTKEMLQYLGGVAVSADMDKVDTVVAQLNELRKLVEWQYPLGAHLVPETASSKEALAEALEKLGRYHVVLLGYKTCGRGANVTPTLTPKDVDEVLDDMRAKDTLGDLSIDTTMAKKLQGGAFLTDISSCQYATMEFASIYFDAVANQYGPSSYAPERMDTPSYSDFCDGAEWPLVLQWKAWINAERRK